MEAPVSQLDQLSATAVDELLPSAVIAASPSSDEALVPDVANAVELVETAYAKALSKAFSVAVTCGFSAPESTSQSLYSWQCAHCRVHGVRDAFEDLCQHTPRCRDHSPSKRKCTRCPRRRHPLSSWDVGFSV